jgi:hypothetical protein
MERCDGCGFEYDLTQVPTAATLIVAETSEFISMFNGDAELRARRESGVWSPLEYGCHLRDMLLVQRERVLAARRRDRPSCEPMGRDERVEHDGYTQQNPADVVDQLSMAAQLFANVLERLSPGDWDRTVLYNYPRQSERSLRWVAVHTVHEVRHHTFDIRRQLAGETPKEKTTD